MKQNTFKKLIKEAVREAIQEESKEILIEAVKAPKSQVIEHVVPNSSPAEGVSPSMGFQERRESYKNILGDMQSSFNTKNVPQTFNPQGTMPGSDLPQGEVNMSQIMNLMKSK